MSEEEILDEILFQKAMLTTIDDSVQNREEAEASVKFEIRRLERLLRALREDKHKPASVMSMGSVPNAKDLSSYSSDPFGLPDTTNGMSLNT